MDNYKETVFLIEQGSCAHELKQLRQHGQCTIPLQMQAGENLHIERGGGHEAPQIDEDPLVIDSFWEEGQFYLRVQPLVGWPCFNGWLPICEYKDSTSSTFLIVKEKKGEGKEEEETKLGGWGSESGEELGGGEYNPNTVHDILKELF